MRSAATTAFAVLLLAGLQAGAAEGGGDAADRLHSLFDAEWERGLAEDPVRATYVGDQRYSDRWPDLSAEARARSSAADQQVLAELGTFQPGALQGDDRLTLELFRRMYEEEIAAERWGLQFLPLNQRDGVQSAHEIAEATPFASVADYEAWLSRLASLDRYVDQTVELMREGIARGLVQPRVIMERIPAQIARQIVDDPTESPFYAPMRTMPASLPAAEQERLRTRARTVIATQIVPAYRRLQAFFLNEYLPACRDSVGIWDTPGGEAWYQRRVRWFTTTGLTPDEIHSLGLAEVERIRGEMQRVIERVGFEGSFAEFLHFLRTDPRFRYNDPQALLRAYESMAKRVDPLLPQFFGRLPRMPYGVRPIPAESAPDTTTAYYRPPSMDGRRAGYYYVNLYKPEERPTYEIPVLTIHEAVPGHHLQIALAQELGELPMFRRTLEATAFIEGWALYSESIGDEMGLYEDPYDKFGQLTYEMWRAVRLVVDTGIHHGRWTRQQSIDFFKANAAKSELDIVNEIDRYIAWPGQALAYKVGELRIKDLRAEATRTLGERFDVREFHDVVLGSGAVPLDVLERNVADWLHSRAEEPVERGR